MPDPTVKLRFLRSCMFGSWCHSPGEVVECDAYKASILIERGLAEVVRDREITTTTRRPGLERT